MTTTDPSANRILVDYEPKLGSHLVRVVVGAWPPPETGLVAGEAVHSLRSALDYVTWQLAAIHKGRKARPNEAPHIAFPICDKPELFARSSVLKHISEEAAKEMAFHQPYAPPLSEPAHQPCVLRVLRKLSNMDKHQVLIPSGFRWVGTQALTYTFDRPIIGLQSWVLPIADYEPNADPQLPHEFPLARLNVLPSEIAPEVKINVDPQPPVYPEVGGFEASADLKTLEAIADCVEFIIRRFDRFFEP